jgi:hypothetical protein
MAWDEGQGQITDLSFKAAADLSALQYTFVKLDANGNVIAASAAGEKVVGVLQNKPKLNETAVVRPLGLSKVVASAAIAAGDYIATTAGGQAKTALRLVQASGNASNVIGMALRAAAGAGIIITADIQRTGIWPTADV